MYKLYTLLGFSDLAFELLIQPSTSFLQYSAGIFTHSLWQNWCNSARTAELFQFTPQLVGVWSGHCDGQSNTFTLKVYVRSLSWPSFNFLADVLKLCFSTSRKCTSSFSSNASPQQDAATPYFHSLDGSPLSSYNSTDHNGQRVHVLFLIDQRTLRLHPGSLWAIGM